MAPSGPGPTGYTIGYGGRAPDEFARLLAAANVKTVVDVRIRPDKAAMGTYVLARGPGQGIVGLLARGRVGYVSLPELGNLFRDYADWPQRYETFLAAAGPLLFDRLAEVPGPVCLMCAEKKVGECHRRHLAAYLERTAGWRFTHLE